MFKLPPPAIKSSLIGFLVAISMSSLSAFAVTTNTFNSYKFTVLGTGGLSYSYSNALAINNAGQVVGYARSSFGGDTPLLWDTSTGDTKILIGGSVATDINASGQIVGVQGTNPTTPLSWSSSQSTGNFLSIGGNSPIYGGGNVNAINDAGKAVGNIFTSAGGEAHIWDVEGNTTTSLGNLGRYSFANDINNAGQVVGFGDTSTNANYHALMWNTSNQTITNLGAGFSGGYRNGQWYPGFYSSEANAINASGLVVGNANYTDNASSGGYSHAMLWDTNNNTVINLGKLAIDTQTYAYDINDAGLIVGSSGGIATLWSNGSIYNLNSFLDESTVNAGWELTEAKGINNNGWIVGNAYNASQGLSSAFLLAPVSVPVPEPETFAMLLMGIGVLRLTVRRQKLSLKY